eukprot:5103115-Alexandrium_andersonii.AAC.1
MGSQGRCEMSQCSTTALEAENFGTSHGTALGNPAKPTVLGKTLCIRSAVGTPQQSLRSSLESPGERH